MTKRWERALRGLNHVEVPTERMRERAQRQPAGGHQDPTRSPRQRIVAGVVAFAVFIVAGTFAWRAFRPAQERSPGGDLNPRIVVTLRILGGGGDGAIPTATLKIGDRTVMGRSVGDSFGRFQSGNPQSLGFSNGQFVPVTRGVLLGAAGDAASVDAELQEPGTFPFAPVVSLGQLRDAVALDDPPGRYVLALTGHWLPGSATFYFPIDLQDQPAIPPPDAGPASLTFVGKNAPEATLAYADAHQDGVRTDYTWCDGSTSCVNGIADFATYPPAVEYLPIPAGTTLTISGDATAIAIFYLDPRGEEGPVRLDPGVIPPTPGRYVIELDVGFDRGSATFFIGVQATASLTASAIDLAGSDWRLVSIDGVAIPARTEPITLRFHTSSWLDGSDGCNNYTARYSLEGSSIRLAGGGVTDVFCAGEAQVRAQALAEGLRNATSFQLAGDRLTIVSPTTTLVFVPAYII